MTDEFPFVSPARLIAALQRLNADLVAGFALARDEEARKLLQDRIKRLQERAASTPIEQFADQQRETATSMLLLLAEWSAMLDTLRRLDFENDSD
jgi:hypothetical protein